MVHRQWPLAPEGRVLPSIRVCHRANVARATGRSLQALWMIGSFRSPILSGIVRESELEIQPHRELGLPCWGHGAWRTKCRVGCAGNAIAKLLRDRACEGRRPIDGIDGIDIRAVEQIKDLSARFGFQPFA